MFNLPAIIESMEVLPGAVALFWLGQAGFVIKTSSRQLIYIDAYISYMCETTLNGGVMSKRLIPPLLEPSDITRGLYAATHMHQDHNDEEAIAEIAGRSPEVRFAGPVSCLRELKKQTFPKERFQLLKCNESYKYEGYTVQAVYADHGPEEPEAIGIVVEVDGIRIYHTGDTCYCPERMQTVIDLKPDIMIACINGTYGNLNGYEAAKLARDVGAKVAIPCHFWMFVGQNRTAEGTPWAFLKGCEEFAPLTRPVILRIGEPFVFARD